MPAADPPIVSVPQDIQQRFPDFVALIVGSESMNDEERQYWINILPVMTEEQLENLRQILQNEKDQLAAIDQRYIKESQGVGSARGVEEIGAERRNKQQGRASIESEEEKTEREKEEQVLREIEKLGSSQA